MKTRTERSPFRVCALAALLATLSGGAWADRTPTAEELAAQAKLQAITAIASNRAGTIADLVNQWSSAAAALGYPVSAWSTEFANKLQSANDTQLYGVQQAANYDGVRAVLQGRSTPASLGGLAGTADLGDSTNDLTFTPVTPCRILDTRFDTDGAVKPALGVVKNYLVYGTAAQLLPQGHTAGTGCASPKGEPAAIAANFTVANAEGNGNIKPFPFGAAVPNASFLNYQANANLANAGIVATCYLCASDLSIQSNFALTHYLADVMGYFYPAEIGTAVELRHGGYDLATETITAAPPTFIGPTTGNTTISLNGGEDVLIEFTAIARNDTLAFVGTAYPAYRNTATNVVTLLSAYENQVDFCFPAGQHSIQASARVASMPAGSYEFGFHAIKGADACSGGAADYQIQSKKISVTKVRRP